MCVCIFSRAVVRDVFMSTTPLTSLSPSCVFTWPSSPDAASRLRALPSWLWEDLAIIMSFLVTYCPDGLDTVPLVLTRLVVCFLFNLFAQVEGALFCRFWSALSRIDCLMHGQLVLVCDAAILPQLHVRAHFAESLAR
jgi:hypothetical protein